MGTADSSLPVTASPVAVFLRVTLIWLGWRPQQPFHVLAGFQRVGEIGMRCHGRLLRLSGHDPFTCMPYTDCGHTGLVAPFLTWARGPHPSTVARCAAVTPLPIKWRNPLRVAAYLLPPPTTTPTTLPLPLPLLPPPPWQSMSPSRRQQLGVGGTGATWAACTSTIRAHLHVPPSL